MLAVCYWDWKCAGLGMTTRGILSFFDISTQKVLIVYAVQYFCCILAKNDLMFQRFVYMSLLCYSLLQEYDFKF